MKIRAWRELRAVIHPLPPPNFTWPAASSTASALISAAKGGRVFRADNAEISIAAGALLTDQTVTISTPAARGADEESAMVRAASAAGLLVASDGVEFGPTGTRLRRATAVVVPYSAALARAAGLRDFDLAIYLWNPSARQWVRLPSLIDTANHTATTRIFAFSLCKIFGAPRVSSGVR